MFYKYNAYKHIEGQNPKITGVTAEQYYPLFQISYQPILTFSESYCQEILTEFTSKYNQTFKELLSNNNKLLEI